MLMAPTNAWLTTAEVLERTGLPGWKLEYLTKVEGAAVQALVARTVPPKSRLWLPEAVERLVSMASARSRGTRAC
jgi:hypothetical protein